MYSKVECIRSCLSSKLLLWLRQRLLLLLQSLLFDFQKVVACSCSCLVYMCVKCDCVCDVPLLTGLLESLLKFLSVVVCS